MEKVKANCLQSKIFILYLYIKYYFYQLLLSYFHFHLSFYYFIIYLFSENRNLKSSDIEVLVLDILDINKHESAFNSIITKFGRVNTYMLSIFQHENSLLNFNYVLN